MDVTILFRLGPALLVAWVVAQRLGRVAGAERRDVTDQLLRVLIIGLVVGRVVHLVLEPAPLDATLGIAMLVRAGVETGAAVLVAVALVARDARAAGSSWLAGAAVTAALAGMAVWHGLCEVQGVCAGTPAAWGVRFSGRAFPAVPTAYIEAALLAGLGWMAWGWRDSLRRVLAVGAVGAIVRIGLGFVRPVLGGHPSRDQLWFLVIALLLAAAAWRRWPDLDAATVPNAAAPATDDLPIRSAEEPSHGR